MESGTWEAIVYHWRHRDFWMTLDEVWHTRLLDWLLPSLHYRFCQWASLRG